MSARDLVHATVTHVLLLGLLAATVDADVLVHEWEIPLEQLDGFTHSAAGTLAVPMFDASEGEELVVAFARFSWSLHTCFLITNTSGEGGIAWVERTYVTEATGPTGVIWESSAGPGHGGINIGPYGSDEYCPAGSRHRFTGQNPIPYAGEGTVPIEYQFAIHYELEDPDSWDIEFLWCECPYVVRLEVGYCYTVPCAADVDDDGAVGLSDVIAVLAAWTDCCNPQPADVNCDFEVNAWDLAEVLARWGACPRD